MQRQLYRCKSRKRRILLRRTHSGDAEVRDFVSQIVGGLGPTIGGRRRWERRPFPIVQNAAPMHGDGLPSASSFRPVLCYDLSQSGVAFFWPEKPIFETAVLALSNGDRTMHLMARVRHFREGFWHGQRQYLVGCEFLCRVRYPQDAVDDDEAEVLAERVATVALLLGILASPLG